MARNRLVGNIASMALWQAGNYLIPLVTFPYLTRVLGIRSFGEFGFSFAIMTYLVLVTDWGFSLSASAAVARHRDDPAKLAAIVWNTLAAKAVIAVACLVVLALGILIVQPDRSLAWTLFAASLAVVANVITVNWCLQGLERLGSFAFAATLGRALAIPAIFLLVQGPQDSWVAALVQASGGVAGGLASLVMLARLRMIGAPRVTAREVRLQLRDGWHTFISTISASIYTTTNTVVLGLLGGPAAVGIYAAADRLRAAAQGVVNPISQAVYPHSTRLMHQDRAAGLRFARRLLLLQGAFCLLVSITLFFGAPLIIRILAGPDYAASVPILRLLAPVPFLVGISNVLGVQMLLPLGFKARFSAVLAGAAGVNLVLVLPLTWLLASRGAAIATLLAELFVVGAMLAVLSRAKISFFGKAGVPHSV